MGLTFENLWRHIFYIGRNYRDFFCSGSKGDLAFWYNIELNQNVDYLTFHGGCPVLVGSKWITNKWIRPVFILPLCELYPQFII